jgi:hypothetical protein
MRCVSDDLIKTIDNQRQNARGFYVRGKWSGREQEHRTMRDISDPTTKSQIYDKYSEDFIFS